MKVAIPKETWPGERRVALVPGSCKKLIQAGMEVWVEIGAGLEAYFPDAAFKEAGAILMPDAGTLLAGADMILKVHPPGMNTAAGRPEVDLMRNGAVLVTTLVPARNLEAVRALAARKITAFATAGKTMRSSSIGAMQF
ncbi:MAG: hypothetical protein LAP85_12350 [Acidobacteriia bacterium]|nr:hypothetical protein [Terriglobia bacterium]